MDSAGHFVQFYGGDDEMLMRGIADYVDRALAAGGGAMVVATPEHREGVLGHLAAGATAAIDAGHLVFKDAAEILQSIMIRGVPDARQFDVVVGRAMRELVARSEGGPVHAFGEMVGLLWDERDRSSAVRLEQLWNALRAATPFDLFCAYSMSVIDEELDTSSMETLLAEHTHVRPATQPLLDTAMLRAIGDVLGADAVTPPSPQSAESLVLWVRKHHRAQAEQVLWQARQLYAAQSERSA